MKKLLTIIIISSIIMIILFNSDYFYSKKLVKAIRQEDIAQVQLIIEQHPNCINTYPSITSVWWHSLMDWRILYPLNEACHTGNIELVELLIEKGADVNCNDGYTPLATVYKTKCKNWYKMSLLFIENGASLDYITEFSGGKSAILQDIVTVRPPASSYIEENYEEVWASFNYAIENCDHAKIDWMEVLKHSIWGDRVEIVKFLLDNKYCNVNDCSIGMTALMFATRDSTPEMVQLLLNYGADKSIISSDGQTAYDIAIEFDRKDMIPLLEE